MKWILILLMFQKGYAGGAISTAEFDTRDACIAAGTAVVETDWANTKAFCYPSSEIDLDTTLPPYPHRDSLIPLQLDRHHVCSIFSSQKDDILFLFSDLGTYIYRLYKYMLVCSRVVE